MAGDYTVAQYQNDLMTKYPYTGPDKNVHRVPVNNTTTYSHIKTGYSAAPLQSSKFEAGGYCDIVPGSIKERRARDFFNLAGENARTEKDPTKPTYTTKTVKEDGWFKGGLLGLTKDVGVLNVPKNKEGKYPNLAYVMELTNLPPEAFLNLPDEALKNPGKYVVKAPLQLDPEEVNKLYNN